MSDNQEQLKADIRGVAESTSVMVNTFGTEANTVDKTMDEIVHENFKLTLDEIIETLDLSDAKYKETAKYGHLGIESSSLEKRIKLNI